MAAPLSALQKSYDANGRKIRSRCGQQDEGSIEPVGAMGASNPESGADATKAIRGFVTMQFRRRGASTGGCVLLLVFLVTGDGNSEVDAYATKLLASRHVRADFRDCVCAPGHRSGEPRRVCPLWRGRAHERRRGSRGQIRANRHGGSSDGEVIGGIVEAFTAGVCLAGRGGHVVAD